MPEDNVFIIFFVKKAKHYSVVSACGVAMYIFVHVTKCRCRRISLGHTTEDVVSGLQDVKVIYFNRKC